MSQTVERPPAFTWPDALEASASGDVSHVLAVGLSRVSAQLDHVAGLLERIAGVEDKDAQTTLAQPAGTVVERTETWGAGVISYDPPVKSQPAEVPRP